MNPPGAGREARTNLPFFQGAFPGGPGFLSWGINNAAGPAIRAVTGAYIVSIGSFGAIVATYAFLPKSPRPPTRKEKTPANPTIYPAGPTSQPTPLTTPSATASTSPPKSASVPSRHSAFSTACGRTGSGQRGSATIATRTSHPRASRIWGTGIRSLDMCRRCRGRWGRCVYIGSIGYGGGFAYWSGGGFCVLNQLQRVFRRSSVSGFYKLMWVCSRGGRVGYDRGACCTSSTLLVVRSGEASSGEEAAGS